MGHSVSEAQLTNNKKCVSNLWPRQCLARRHDAAVSWTIARDRFDVGMSRLSSGLKPASETGAKPV